MLNTKFNPVKVMLADENERDNLKAQEGFRFRLVGLIRNSL